MNIKQEQPQQKDIDDLHGAEKVYAETAPGYRSPEFWDGLWYGWRERGYKLINQSQEQPQNTAELIILLNIVRGGMNIYKTYHGEHGAAMTMELEAEKYAISLSQQFTIKRSQL